MKSVLKLTAILTFCVSLASCSLTMRSMKSPNTRVELELSDFELSDQVSAEATSTRILSIDFERLFNAQTASVEADGGMPISAASIPVFGDFVMDPTKGYALYELMNANPGYDVVFYPQFETKIKRPIGLPLITITEVKVTARLGKLKAGSSEE
ncbi:MAG: hypothetical protein KDC92_05335 [Bacteroidetes bacterium]|nr:hypothetical protein [Bacteroidota bacterium]